MIFGKGLAEVYDLIYKDKDYERECDFLEEIFKKYSTIFPVKTVLDAGCGSGGHAIPLAKRGYRVVGFDLSEVMISQARKKAKNLANVEFHVMNLLDFQLDGKFDTCIAMFAVVGYMRKNSEIVMALNNIRKHLKSNGIFIFDVWNGLSCLRNPPERRIKEAENEHIRIIRFAVPDLRFFNHACEVNYKLLVLNKRSNTFDEINEKHVVRFYFPQEIVHYLEETDFEVLKICPFLDLDGTVDENVWNIAVIARAI